MLLARKMRATEPPACAAAIAPACCAVSPMRARDGSSYASCDCARFTICWPDAFSTRAPLNKVDSGRCTGSSKLTTMLRLALLNRGGDAGSSDGCDRSEDTRRAAGPIRPDGLPSASKKAPASAARRTAPPTAPDTWADRLVGTYLRSHRGFGVEAAIAASRAVGGRRTAITDEFPPPLPFPAAPDAASPPRCAISWPPAPTRRAAERFDAAASTFSSNVMESMPVPRSRWGRRGPLSNARGPAASGTTISGRGATAASPLPDRSRSAPGSGADSPRDPDRALADDASARWPGARRTVRLALPPDGGSIAAPPRDVARFPAASTMSRRVRLADDASTCSSNATESVPSPRSRTGRADASSRGAVPSRATDIKADPAASGLPDRSETAPDSSDTRCAPDAKAAAF